MMTQCQSSPLRLVLLALLTSLSMAARQSPAAVVAKPKTPGPEPEGVTAESFPKLPAVATIMGASFETLGGQLTQEVDKFSAKVHSMQQDDIHMVAQKKTELELKLKVQEENSRKMIAANKNVSQEVATLKKENDGLRAKAKGLRDSNKKIEKELSAMQSSLGLAAKDFTEASSEDNGEEGGSSTGSTQSEDGSSLAQKTQKKQLVVKQQVQGPQAEQEQDEQDNQEAPPQEMNQDLNQQYLQQQEEQGQGDEDGGEENSASSLQDAPSGETSESSEFEGQYTQSNSGEDDGGFSFLATGRRVKTMTRTNNTKASKVKGRPHAEIRKAKPTAARKNFLASGLAAELKDLSKQVTDLGRLEKENDAKLEQSFHTQFEAGKSRQKKLSNVAKQLADTKNRLEGVHTQLAESVKHLESIHTKLSKQLQKVSDSLHSIEKLTSS